MAVSALNSELHVMFMFDLLLAIGFVLPGVDAVASCLVFTNVGWCLSFVTCLLVTCVLVHVPGDLCIVVCSWLYVCLCLSWFPLYWFLSIRVE